MSYDIYGNPLRRGYCEVHPSVNQEYPCDLCASERSNNEMRQAPDLNQDLLQMLKHFVRWHDQLNETDIVTAKALIAKAEAKS